MSENIVERLRSLRHIHVPQLSDEAAAEIERLRALLSRTGSNSRQTCDNAAECRSNGEKLPERDRLTPAESVALAEASDFYVGTRTGKALSGLLERLK